MPSTTTTHHLKPSTKSQTSHHSDESEASQSTAPTSIYSFQQAATDPKPFWSATSEHPTTISPRSSSDTYASTIASQELLFIDDDDDNEIPPAFIPSGYAQDQESIDGEVRPSTPTDFADFFPSSRRLSIRHDDSTYDGNMNLRIETETASRERIQLFHLRMHDLRARQFSLRRYCRDSGREVCHSSRKFTDPERPRLQRSMSNAFASIRGKPDVKRHHSDTETFAAVQRQDSGYGSEAFDEHDFASSREKKASSSVPVPTNITKLDFSNYAQVEVRRRGSQSKKRYDFEYWGHAYHWRRVIEKDGDGQAVSYHLFQDDGHHAVAHIVPELRCRKEMNRELISGNFIPPCSMWISDKKVVDSLADVADVIVSTGLIALVDDSIKRHFPHHPTKQNMRPAVMTFPLTPLKMDVEFVSPRAMVGSIFKRRNSAATSPVKEKDSRASPLKYMSGIEAR